MLTTLLFAITIAGPPDTPVEETVGELRAPDWAAEFAEPESPASSADDVRETAAALQSDLEADAVLATRAGQRLVLSALLCQSVELLTAEGKSTVTARRRLAAIGVEATERLEHAHITPLSCDSYPVARLVACLGLTPPAACTEDDELVAQVRASERLAP